jgi:5-amino-6-(D-ribitylamino)uracil---L-tyrosine 4-hydroxyphenyl transferase
VTNSAITAPVTDILAKARSGANLSAKEAIILLQETNPQLIEKIRETADFLRRQQVGNTVTYVVNRNINFSNICEQHCSFCAFRRDENEEGAFWLNLAEILAKTTDAVDRGATEICMQGGLNPKAKVRGTSLDYYLEIVKNLKNNFPDLHLHAFSPQEVQFIAREDNLSYEKVIASLQAAGLNSLPGTAAEVLVDEVRKVICPEKIDSATWLEIVGIAHRLGLHTTSTMLCGHIETPFQQIQHLEKIRKQQEIALENNYTAKITEFILLPFVGQSAPKPLRNRVGRDQPVLADTLQLTAVARIYLGNWIKNHQPSWVKLGLNGAKEALKWGCNDIGGTLMEEHITTMAGAIGGTCLTVEELELAIKSLDRPYRQRDTIYGEVKSKKE